MSTIGQFSKNPTIKRILKEATELASQRSPDYHAAPLENDLFEWHFTLRGPPDPSPYDGGIYHGRIVLPPAYPLKPPSFRFLTPTGRFEVNREICLSISGHHEETWQPAWGIRTSLVAIRSFMDTSASGQLGGMEASEEVRKRMAGQSANFLCSICGKTNLAIMKEHEDAFNEQGGEVKKEVVPDELRLMYRNEIPKGDQPTTATAQAERLKEQIQVDVNSASISSLTPATPSVVASDMSATSTIPPAQREVHQDHPDGAIPAWIDKAIYGIVIALVFMLWLKVAG